MKLRMLFVRSFFMRPGGGFCFGAAVPDALMKGES